MWVQGRYFAGHPESGYAWLADEVRHPLNEFALLWVDYGVAAPCVLLVCFVSVVVGLVRRKERFPSVCACSLFALFLFSCFSYPFKYPLSALVSVTALCSLLCPVWLHVSIQKGAFFISFIRCAFHMKTDQMPEKTHPAKAVWV